MNSLLILAPVFGAGIGLTMAYGVTHRNRRIHFVERDNLNRELENLDINVGHAETCIECGDDLDPEDVGAVVRESDEYRVVCNKPTCLDTYDIE